MANKTEGVADLVEAILRKLPTPYGEDVIEDIFVAIQEHPRRLKRYETLEAELGKEVLNQWIGQHTRSQTKLFAAEVVETKRTKLAANYTKLRPQS